MTNKEYQAADKVEFTATSLKQAEDYLRKHCNDGRKWIVSSVFDLGRAYVTDKRNVRQDPSGHGFLNEHFWQNGWKERLPATDKQVQKEWDKAYSAGGVSDGSSGRSDKAFWRRQKAKLRKIEARLAGPK